MSDWRERCQSLGFHELADDAAACLERVAAILNNANASSESKESALAIIEAIGAGGLTEPGALRAQELLARHSATRESTPCPELIEQMRAVASPLDPSWKQWIDQSADRGELRCMRSVGQRLSQLTSAFLRGSGAEPELLEQLTSTLNHALTRLDEALSWDARRTLRGYAEQAAAAERDRRIQTLLSSLRHERDAAQSDISRWQIIERQASELRDLAESQEGIELARDLLAQNRRFIEWQERFQGVLKVIGSASATSTLVAAFPWDRHNDPEAPLDREEMIAALQGLAQWGDEGSREVWRLALISLSERQLRKLSADPDPATLVRLRAVMGGWLTELGPLPHASAWSEAEQRLQSRIDQWAEESVGRFRQNEIQTGWREARQGLERNEELLRLRELGASAVTLLEQELDELDSLDERVRSLANSAEFSSGLEDELVEIERRLTAMGSGWSRVPPFVQLRGALEQLALQLGHLRRAEARMDEGRFEEALTLLAEIRSPNADRLRAQAKRQISDRRFIRTLVSEGVEAISDEDLESVSDPVRARYALYLDGNRFVRWLTTEAASLAPELALSELAPRALALQREPLPEGAELTEPDRRAREALSDRLWRQLGDAIERTTLKLERINPYPLPDRDRSISLRDDLSALEEALEMEGLTALGVAIRPRLAAVRSVLSIHDACHAGQWQEALDRMSKHPGSHLERVRLEATVRSAQLAREESDPAAWLTLYRQFPDPLLQQTSGRRDYLALLRNVPPRNSEAEAHRALLEGLDDPPTFLIALLRCEIEPSRNSAKRLLRETPSNSDLDTLGRYLALWAEEPRVARFLSALWDELPDSWRQRAWREHESPIARLTAVCQQRLDELANALPQSAPPFTTLLEGWQRLDQTALLAEGGQSPLGQLAHLLKRGVEIERSYSELEREDPWAPRLKGRLNSLLRKIDELPLPIQEGRGWLIGVRQRQAGIEAWDRIDAAKRDFRHEFDKLPSFDEPKHWHPFIDAARRWSEALERFEERLDWSLPRAHDSQRWRDFKEAWRQSPEGKLYRQADAGIVEEFAQIRQAYLALTDQLGGVATLHRQLAEQRSADLLAQLQETIPLSAPVDLMRAQLLRRYGS